MTVFESNLGGSWLDESTFRAIRQPETHGSGGVLFGKWNAEAVLPSRGLFVLCGLMGVLVLGWLTWRDFSSRRQLREAPALTINKLPIAFANRTFDPTAPPPDMPPLASGENAECDSNFLSNASVRGETIRRLSYVSSSFPADFATRIEFGKPVTAFKHRMREKVLEVIVIKGEANQLQNAA